MSFHRRKKKEWNKNYNQNSSARDDRSRTATSARRPSIKLRRRWNAIARDHLICYSIMCVGCDRSAIRAPWATRDCARARAKSYYRLLRAPSPYSSCRWARMHNQLCDAGGWYAIWWCGGCPHTLAQHVTSINRWVSGLLCGAGNWYDFEEGMIYWLIVLKDSHVFAWFGIAE